MHTIVYFLNIFLMFLAIAVVALVIGLIVETIINHYKDDKAVAKQMLHTSIQNELKPILNALQTKRAIHKRLLINLVNQLIPYRRLHGTYSDLEVLIKGMISMLESPLDAPLVGKFAVGGGKKKGFLGWLFQEKNPLAWISIQPYGKARELYYFHELTLGEVEKQEIKE